MNGVIALYQKELWHYFRSPIAYFVVSVFLIGTGYFYTSDILLTGIATMTETFRNMGILTMVVMPVISMRLFASEHSDGTMELLMTLPLKPWQVVVAKFLGAITILLLMTVGTMINLIPLYIFAEPETWTILSGYFGFFLLGMACLAIGQFFSTLTENQIIAALITISVLLAFWFIGNLQNFQSSIFLTNLFGYLSFSGHYAEFVRGLVRTEALMFYLLVCALALTLNTSYLQWRR